MARTADLDDLVSRQGIAAALRVSPSAVDQWRVRHSNFPRPLSVPGVWGLDIWSLAAVLEWYNARPTSGPLKPRPTGEAARELASQGAVYIHGRPGPERPRFREKTLQRLVDAGAAVWRTDHHGVRYVEEVQR